MKNSSSWILPVQSVRPSSASLQHLRAKHLLMILADPDNYPGDLLLRSGNTLS